MSGICGIVRKNGRPVAREELSAMLAPLERRGPDGTHLALLRQAGLGHTLLATTPESLLEQLPLTDQAAGCTITADVRLDYREELAGKLGLDDGGKAIGDGEMILLSYARWGTDCLDHLRGDFAFAIWDPRNETLFCARDQVGMRQFIYTHRPGTLFAFATEPRALVAHPDIPAEINEARIGDYLEELEACDLTSTFYLGVNRLPPAHALVLDQKGIRTWRYWQMEPPELLNLPDDNAYAQAFLNVFTEAVRTRLRSAGPVGSMLSGGMDSGSVTAIAAKILSGSGDPPLKTYSAIRENRDCLESEGIRAAMAIDHIDPGFASLEDFDSYRDELTRLTQEMGEPFDGHMTLPRAVYLAANRDGIKSMLDGVAGDSTLGCEDMVPWHMGRGELRKAWREVRGERRFWGEDAIAWHDYLRSAMRALAPRSWRKARQAKYRERLLIEAERASPLNPDFAKRIDMAQRRQANAELLRAPVDLDDRKIKRALHPYVVVGRERYDRTASALAIEPRDPFLDLRVIEFCLSLPQEQLQEGGWPKVILRRAVAGALPDSVRWRIGKEHLGSTFTEALWDQWPGTFAKRESDKLRQYVSSERLDAPNHANGRKLGLECNLFIKYLSDWFWGY